MPHFGPGLVSLLLHSRMHNASHACMSHWHASTETFRLASALKTHIDANTSSQTVWTIMQGLSVTLQVAIVALLLVPVGPITGKLWHYTIALKGSIKLHSACMLDLDGYDAVWAPCNKPWAWCHFRQHYAAPAFPLAHAMRSQHGGAGPSTGTSRKPTSQSQIFS